MNSATHSRSICYALLAIAFFIGFFNRFAPATFAAPISDSLGLDAAAIGSLAATHFWVYTLMQVPAGMVVDRFGIRVPAAVGTLLTGVGALVLGMAHNYLVALSGPFLVGFGMSMVFVSVMKNNAIWFDCERFGMITGITLLIGTLGSIIAEAPSHFVLQFIHWRPIFITLGLVTMAVAVLIGLLWRPPPSGVGNESSVMQASLSKPPQGQAWLNVIGNRQLWLILLAISGTNGTFYAFAGLWGTQLLSGGSGLSGAAASLIITLALVLYGLGSPVFGHLSDRLRTRKHFIWFASLLNAVAWMWLLAAPGAGSASGLACFLALGLSAGAQVVVSFAAVKESVETGIAGFAIAFVNMGVFLTTATIQTVYGWLITSAMTDPDPASVYRLALWLPASLSLLGLAAAFLIRETYPVVRTVEVSKG